MAWHGPSISLALTLGAFAVVAAPSEARACGGTFCDAALPMSMPVNQTGETILFAIDNGFVEAHIQIEYDGADAEEFSWILPVPEIPEIEIGSWRLVESALAGTVPVYGYQDADLCSESDTGSNSGGVGFVEDPDGGGGSGPTVLARDVVGAFEFVVLQGGTSDTVTDWLSMNGYTVESEAPTILDEYITEGHVFVAFRLRHGQAVEDIHPVVIRYPGSEPCIPLRLTRVAAEEDMEVRALFLGEARVVPTNYRHVRLNRTRLDWLSFGANYQSLVSAAVDAPGADGRAFVTEYAGPTSVVDTTILDTSAYDSSAFADIPIVDVVGELGAQGLVTCNAGECEWWHELVSSLLHDFVPVPPGLDDGEFYSCLSCYAGLIDLAAWDPVAFMAAYDERIVAPLQHATDLLETWPYITRLYTTISPHEMLSDPLFEEHPALDTVAHRHGAQRQQECCGNAMRLPGGRVVWMPDDTWPEWPAAMPWAEEIEEYAPGGGPPVVLADQSATIDMLVSEWNQTAACTDDPDTGGLDSTGPGDGTAGDGPGDGTAGTATGGAAGTTSSGAGQDDTGAEGCGCTSRGPTGGRTNDAAWLLLAGLGLVVARRRRA